MSIFLVYTNRNIVCTLYLRCSLNKGCKYLLGVLFMVLLVLVCTLITYIYTYNYTFFCLSIYLYKNYINITSKIIIGEINCKCNLNIKTVIYYYFFFKKKKINFNVLIQLNTEKIQYLKKSLNSQGHQKCL